MCISWTGLAFLLCEEAKRASKQQLALLFSFSGRRSCACIIQAEDSCGGSNHELTWLRLYDSVNSLFLCVPRPCILETLSCLPPLISLSLSGTACSFITLHWTTHLLDRAWLIKSFADPIKWKKNKIKNAGVHTQRQRSVHTTLHLSQMTDRALCRYVRFCN